MKIIKANEFRTNISDFIKHGESCGITRHGKICGIFIAYDTIKFMTDDMKDVVRHWKEIKQ